jgi:hypothetical protein
VRVVAYVELNMIGSMVYFMEKLQHVPEGLISRAVESELEGILGGVGVGKNVATLTSI